jgi:hypothetical protein
VTDWFDPLGFRGIADRVFTSAARTLVGRRIEVGASTPMAATIARVHDASPAVNVSAALNAQIGLWRRLDLVLERVEVGGRSMHRVKVVADDVRVIDALPQRLGAKNLELEIKLVPDQVGAWIDAIPLKVDAHIENGRVVARRPGYGRWGEVILEPWVRGREIGADAVAARTRGREVRLPDRFKRTFSRELTWLPEGADLRKLEFSEEGGACITATITRFDVPIDVPRLLADLSNRGTKLAVQTIRRPL